MGRLQNKVAIITGAAKGQGATEAKLFAKEGAKVVATDIDVDSLKKVVDEINADGGQALAVQHNVTTLDSWETVVEQTIAHYEKIDILINNAGITGPLFQKIEDVTDETWDKVMAINAKGVFYGMKVVIPFMKENKGGSIVNISSLAGINGVGNAAYNTSKAGVRMMTKNVALDYGKEHIRVNSVHPGAIETPMIADIMIDPQAKAESLASIPLGFLGQSEDVAYGVLFLASDEARFVTGTELIMDGGYLLR